MHNASRPLPEYPPPPGLGTGRGKSKSSSRAGPALVLSRPGPGGPSTIRRALVPTVTSVSRLGQGECLIGSSRAEREPRTTHHDGIRPARDDGFLCSSFPEIHAAGTPLRRSIVPHGDVAFVADRRHSSPSSDSPTPRKHCSVHF